MGLERTKLDVMVDKPFLVNFSSGFNSQEDFYFKESFRRKVLNLDNSSIKTLMGIEYDKEEFNTVLARSNMQNDSTYLLKQNSNAAVINKDFISDTKSINPTTLFLLDKTTQENMSLTHTYGFLFWNHKQIKNGFKSLCLNDDVTYDSEKKININSPSKPFEYNHLSDFKLPSNIFVINDQFISKWDKNTFEKNTMELIKNILIDIKQKYKPTIKIICRIRENNIKPEEENTKIQIEILQKHIENVAEYEYLAIKEYKIKKEVKLISKIDKNQFFDILHTLHDRFFYSNYLFGLIPNSTDFKGEYGRKKTILTISSLIKANNLEALELYRNAVDRCFELVQKKEFESFFFYHTNKR